MNAKQLQGFLVDDICMEDLILAKSALRSLDNGVQEAGIETPEWVTDKMALVTAEITNRNRVELQKRLKAVKARRSALATMDEKRSRLESEISDLEKKLG